MRDFELNKDEDQPLKPVKAAIVSSVPNVSSPTDLSEAHEALLREIDDVRRLAQLMTDRMEALEARLAPTEAALTRQTEMLERVAREAMAETAREWAQTAARYRKFVDDMGSLASWQQERMVKASDPKRSFRGALLGGFLAAVLLMVMTASVIAASGWLREKILGSPSAVSMSTPAAEQSATTATPARAKPGKAAR